MRLSSKSIEEVVSEAIGPDVVPLVSQLRKSKDVSELRLAKVMKREINEVRNLLYKLYHSNLVSFNKKKDEKQGIYCYYWSFNSNRVKYIAKDIKKKQIEKLKDRLGREDNSEFFACPTKCMRLEFEQAMSYEYKCPECGQLLNQVDNKNEIKKITEEIRQLEIALRD